MDRKSQIVYKSGYKDISEFDGLFFTKKCVYFVESTIVKDTTGLRKRMRKKKSLLEVLFPKLTVRSLVILNEEATGVSAFPSFCTVWITKNLDVTHILENLKNFDEKTLKPFEKINSKKIDEVYNLEPSNFKYFASLNWILKQLKKDRSQAIDVEFLKSETIEKYYDIYSKIFIGLCSFEDFKNFNGKIDEKAYQEIVNSEIEDDKVYVAIEKTHREKYVIVFFLKIVNGKLKRIEINEERVSIQNKDSKGFTYSEIKYLNFVFKHYHKLKSKQLKTIQKLI